jgi:hypothetical protein
MNFFQGKSRRGSATNGLGIPKLEKKESFKTSEKGPSLEKTESFKKKSKNNLASKSNLTREDSFRSAAKDESTSHRGRRGSKLDPSLMPVPSAGSRRGSIQGGPSGPGARRGSMTYDDNDPFGMMAMAQPGKKPKSKTSAPVKDTSRRGSLSPNGRRTSVGGDHKSGHSLDPNANRSVTHSRTASVFVNAVQRVNSNQILMLKEIHGALHSLRMVHFAGTMTPLLKSPLDDVTTVKIPDPTRNQLSVPEIFRDILHLASDQRYFYECNFHTWTGNEEILDDLLNSFAGKNVEFNSKLAYETVFDAYGSRAAWASLENGIKELYASYGNDTSKFYSKESREGILKNVYVLLGNWTAFTRLGHVALVNHVNEWFKKYSEDDWKTSNVPVVYGAFNNGLDVLTLFGRIKNQISTLDLIALRDWYVFFIILPHARYSCGFII